MKELNPENAFVGATVYTEKNEKKFIYKVNQKSVYIGDKSWEVIKDKKGKRRWTDFMRSVGGEKVGYFGLYITEAEIASEDKFVKTEEKRDKQKRYLSQLAESELKDTYESRVIGKSNKTYKYVLEFGRGKKCSILEANKYGQFLISLMNGKNYFFYDVLEDVYTDLNIKEHKRGKIEWPEKETAELAKVG